MLNTEPVCGLHNGDFADLTTTGTLSIMLATFMTSRVDLFNVSTICNSSMQICLETVAAFCSPTSKQYVSHVLQEDWHAHATTLLLSMRTSLFTCEVQGV